MSNSAIKIVALAVPIIVITGMGLALLQNSSPVPVSERLIAESTDAPAASESADEKQSSEVKTPSEKPVTSESEQAKEDKTMSAHIYDFKVKTLDGEEVGLDKYKGDVLLIVNTASKCGYTPQYAGLEDLHKKYSEKGLRVLGFPCNQFGGQEPGNSREIGAFCQKNYGVDFQMFEKVDVNGKDAHPLYKYLTSEAKGALGTEAIKWNFTKFLVDRNGEVLKRYAPTVKPEEIVPDIEKELAVASNN